MDISKGDVLQKCLETCHLLISPKRLHAHLSSIQLEVPKMLPLHQFLLIVSACIDMPNFASLKSPVRWGERIIRSIPEAYEYLDRQYIKESYSSHVPVQTERKITVGTHNTRIQLSTYTSTNGPNYDLNTSLQRLQQIERTEKNQTPAFKPPQTPQRNYSLLV